MKIIRKLHSVCALDLDQHIHDHYNHYHDEHNLVHCQRDCSPGPCRPDRHVRPPLGKDSGEGGGLDGEVV